ncbi:MAG: SPRY domain-containing protein [Bacillota bacterium]
MATVNVILNPNDMNVGNELLGSNLTVTSTKTYAAIRATHGKTTGKWYWEVRLDNGSNASMIGIANMTFSLNADIRNDINQRTYGANGGGKYPDSVNYGTSMVIGDTIGVALDMDNGKLEFYKNGVSMGISHTNIKPLGEVFPMISSFSSTTKTNTFNFGKTPFKYKIPEGYTPYVGVNIDRVLIFNGSYFKYDLTEWKKITTNLPTEIDYLNGNVLGDISSIPESAWLQLKGNVELCYYTDDPNKTEVLFNIETEPFTLAEEWKGQTINIMEYTDDPNVIDSKVTLEYNEPFTLAEEWEDQTIKVIEYTDDPNITESTVTIDTEPFTFYDEFEDNVDVLYYTDDPDKINAELELTANYTPLDDIKGDFDVVTWTDDEETQELNVKVNAHPFSQLVVQEEDFQMYGNLQNIIVNKISATGTVKFLLSFDGGSTWEYNIFNKWRTVNINDPISVKKNAMDITTISSLAPKDFSSKGSKIRIAYYLDDDPRRDENIQLDNIKIVSNAPVEDVKFDDVAFYILNTTATIQLTIGGNKLTGQLDDADKGKVQYRVFLNDNPYYPSDGNFTPLAPSPLDIKLNISEREIIFGQENILTVEFQDAWGQTDTWSKPFIGTYSGLMFMDESGQYYSDSFGRVLKYLDFDVIIAGQTTIDQKVIVKNQLGQVVQNLILEVVKEQLPEGVTLELSHTSSPFIAEDYLLFNKLIQPDDTMEFYVRIATDITAPPVPNGQFEIRAKVDTV